MPDTKKKPSTNAKLVLDIRRKVQDTKKQILLHVEHAFDALDYGLDLEPWNGTDWAVLEAIVKECETKGHLFKRAPGMMFQGSRDHCARCGDYR